MMLLQRNSWQNLLVLCSIFHEIFANPQSKICLTKGCITTASSVIDAMDTTIDPCDDFYNFACGNYIKQSNLLDKDVNSVFTNMGEKSMEQVRIMLSEPLNKNDIKPFRLVKSYYAQCMDGTGGVSSFLEIVDKFGGWPILKGEKWNENEFNLEESILEIQKYKEDNYLFNMHVIGVTISLSSSLPSENKYRNSKKYRSFMSDLVSHFGIENPDKSQLDEVFTFETKLEAINRKNDTENEYLVTIKEFNRWNKYLNWTNHITKTRSFAEEDSVINIVDPEYFTKLGELIKSTSKRTLANYLVWSLTKSLSNYLSKDIHYLSVKYISPKKVVKRWEFCFKEVYKHLRYPVDAMYIKKNFDMNTKRNIKEMIKSIRTEAIKTFQAADWMNELTQVKLLDKMKNLEFKYVGFINELLDSVKMKRNYENFDLSTNFFLSTWKFTHHTMTEQYSHDLGVPPFMVNAFYTKHKNSITFPAVILHSPFYDSNRPQYMNYGAIGWIIGHEISHMFRNGTEFLGEDRVKCLIDQYTSYIEPTTNKTLNGALTITEDLPDNIGVKVAYKTYKHYIDFVGEELQLPGLNYTPEQLFWIAGAQKECSRFGIDATEYMIKYEDHTLPSFRVFGTYRNMVEFSEDFKCSKNSKMNPSKRCEIWQ